MFNILKKSSFLKIRTRNLTSFDFEQLSLGSFLYDENYNFVGNILGYTVSTESFMEFTHIIYKRNNVLYKLYFHEGTSVNETNFKGMTEEIFNIKDEKGLLSRFHQRYMSEIKTNHSQIFLSHI